MTDDTLTGVDEGCTHYRSRRPELCPCGNLAAFWTPPAGTCQVCNRPQAIWDQNGDGPPHRGWCTDCRNHAVTPDDGQVQP